MFLLLIIINFIVCIFPLAAVQHPNGFITVAQCKEKNSPVTYLLSESKSKQFVLILDKGVVVNEGGIVTKEGKILKDTETYRADQQHLLRGKRNIAEEDPGFFDGRLAVISSPGQENWYHWLLQVLPRLKILADSGVQYDKIYINNLQYPWQKKSLSIVMKKLGISEDRLFLLAGDAVVEAKTLIVPSVAHMRGSSFPRWYKQFLQDCFLDKTIKKAKLPTKIYISRSKATLRRILNEEALIFFLKDHGFTVVHLEELSVFEQASLFRNAKVIIGPHGSGFANLIFSRPKVKVIEIDHGLVGEQRSCYKRIAELMHCAYLPFFVDVVQEFDLERDIKIDVDAFKRFYQQVKR